VGYKPIPNQSIPLVTCSCRPPVILTIIGVPQESDSNVANPNPSASEILIVQSTMLYIAARCSGAILFLDRRTCLSVSNFKCLIIWSKSCPWGSLGSVCKINCAFSCKSLLSSHSLNHQTSVPECFLRAFLLFQKKIVLSLSVSGKESFLSFSFCSSVNGLKISAEGTIDTVYIYNVLGKKIMSVNVNNTQDDIDISNLTSGVYLIKFTVDGRVGTSKFIKQ